MPTADHVVNNPPTTCLSFDVRMLVTISHQTSEMSSSGIESVWDDTAQLADSVRQDPVWQK
jgi:hypothetical protein